MINQSETQDPRFLEAQALLDRRIKMRNLNLEAINHYLAKEQELSRRISKVNTIQKFNSKLKAENRNLEALIAESITLNLTNYLEEIANILSETISEKQVDAMAEMASVMAQSYQRFSTLFIPLLKKQFESALANPDTKKSTLKALTHLMAELFVCGLPITYKDINDLIRKIFKAAANSKVQSATQQQRKQKIYEFNSEVYAVLIIRYGEVLTGKTSKQVKEWEAKGLVLPKFPSVFPAKAKTDLAAFFEKYVRELSGFLEGNYKLIKETQATLTQELKLNGSFNPDTEKRYKSLCERFQNTRVRLFQIGTAIDEIIENAETISKPVLEPADISKSFLNITEGGQIFEDEYQKELYRELPHIADIEAKATEDDKALYDAFKVKLDNCKNTADADELVKEFLKINTKRNRKYLSKDLLLYRKEYQLVTPYLCRIAATLNQKWKDVGEFVSEFLFSDYQKLKESVNNDFVANDRRTRNMKYICEFTKFEMIDPLKTLGCIKALVDQLNGFNIDLLVSCLDFVGRYLYLNTASSQKFNFLLTQLSNILKKKSLPIMTEAQIINSMNLLKPAAKVETTKVKRQKSPFEIALKNLLMTLAPSKVDDHHRQLRKLQNENPTQFEALFLKKLLKRIPKHKYTENYVFAQLVRKINDIKLEKELRVATKAKLFESVNMQHSQEVLEWARFEGELFNEEITEKDDLYGTVYELLKIEGNSIGVINSVCSILEATKSYKIRKTKSINQKLRLMFAFKKYVNTRKYIPMFIEFEILDIFEALQPQVVKMTNKEITDFEASMDQKQKSRHEEINELTELQYLQKPKIYKEKPKYKLKATQEEEPQQEDERREVERTPEKSPDQEFKDLFEKEFAEIVETELSKNEGRMIKKHKIDENFVKKKDRKKAGESDGPSVNIIGRIGDAMVRREIRLKKD